jgi:hypothetical protein
MLTLTAEPMAPIAGINDAKPESRSYYVYISFKIHDYNKKFAYLRHSVTETVNEIHVKTK